tara:strand:+ start:1658 stop:1822 length:165 start_codon:yes stop_codon:yes gene_type:complete
MNKRTKREIFEAKHQKQALAIVLAVWFGMLALIAVFWITVIVGIVWLVKWAWGA